MPRPGRGHGNAAAAVATATAIATTAGSASAAGITILPRPALTHKHFPGATDLQPADRGAEISAELFALSDDDGRLAALQYCEMTNDARWTWPANEKTFKHLSLLARSVPPVLCSSTDAKRLFSAANNICSVNRTPSVVRRA